MNQSRMTTIIIRFFSDVEAELARAKEKFPSNHHMLGAMHEEVGEVAKAFLERDYKSSGKLSSMINYGLDEDVYKECVQAAAMVLRVATEGDPEYRYRNPHNREIDGGEIPVPPGPLTEDLGLNINEVQVQLDSNQKNVKLTHQPTGCFAVCDKHATQWENQAAALKTLSEAVREHLQWAPQDDALVIPAFLRRGDNNEQG